MHGLRNRGFAAGKTLGDFEQALFDRGNRVSSDIDVSGPIRIHERIVPNEWVDYNGHTNDSRYMQITSEAGDKFMRLIGVDEAYLQSGCTTTPSRATSASSPRATPAIGCTSPPS